MKYLLILLFSFANILHSQELLLLNQFGEFTSSSSFDIDLNGNIYIADIVENTITKLDSTGDEVLSIGGYGWDESSFDEPVSIITNTLSIYVADKNNDRIQRFDKDLNFLSQYSGRVEESEIEFAYPTCIEISNIGDLFFLDSDNNRLLKYNLTGEFLSEIGSNDAGSFSLINPKFFTIDETGNIFVLDENIIKVFDQFGNGQFSFIHNYTSHKIYAGDEKILYVENSRLVFFDLMERKIIFEFDHFPELLKEDITDAKIIDDILYILSPTKILKYKILL